MSKICFSILSFFSIGLAQSILTESVGNAITSEPSNIKWWIIVAIIVGAAFYLRMKKSVLDI